MANIQDFSLINTNVKKYMSELNLEDASNAFYYFVLRLILELQDDEIDDSITDNFYLTKKGKSGGHDRGIDAIYIDDASTPPIIHLFNCKYAETFPKTAGNYPAGEIDKIANFLNALMLQDDGLKDSVNPILSSKVQEIWNLFQNVNPHFSIHICSNFQKGFEKNEKTRFEREINRHSNFEIHYHFIDELVKRITKRGKQKVNAKLKPSSKELIEKSDGDVRALIIDVDAKDLIRIVLDNRDLRESPELNNYEEMKKYSILEDAFEDNVRIYLKQKTKINTNIKRTALSDERQHFFYFNNGITITCDRFEYPKTMRPPMIVLENIQVVNGSQTVHALYEAFLDDSSKFDYINILCRVYEIKNSVLSTRIAEYTNSQNPVQGRDIRSIDFTQQKIEQELLVKNFFYERKKGQYSEQPKDSRLDAEKVGQVLMSFYNAMPAEAKNNKKLIFGEKYDEVFDDTIDADKILLAYQLFEKIEREKKLAKQEIVGLSAKKFKQESFILYASYYLLYALNLLAQKQSIALTFSNLSLIWSLYPKAVKILREFSETEQKGDPSEYSHRKFFTTITLKKLLDDKLSNNSESGL